MINNLKNVTSKSFVDYSCDETLGYINIFFGKNGAGKSGLSNWIMLQNPDHVRIFNSDYVMNNIKITDDEEINGINLIVGNEQISYSDLVELLKESNKSIFEVEEKLSKRNKNINENLYNIINQLLADTRLKFKGIKINHKPKSKEEPIDAIKAWKNDSLKDVKNIDIDSSKELENRKNILQNDINTLTPILKKIDQERFSNVQDYLSQRIIAPEEKYSNNLLIWLREGIEIHNLNSDKEANEACKFCGNTFDTKKTLQLITEKLKSNFSNFIKAIDEFIYDIQSISLNNELLSLLDNEKVISNYNKASCEILEILRNKKQNPLLSLNISDDLINNFLQLDSIIYEKRKVIQEELDLVQSSLNNMELIAKYRIGDELNKNQQVKELQDEFMHNEKIICKNQIAREENNNQIGLWEQLTSDYNGFKEIVNFEFENLGFEFRLEILETKSGYKLMHKNPEINLRVKDLSEGERRFLAFLHFYYSLFKTIKEDEIELDPNIEQIVIDDPITSFDSDNRIYLIERINNFINQIKNSNIQLFIFTHSSFDFHNFGYNAGNTKKLWRILKDIDGNSYIKLLTRQDMKNFSDYYKSTFLEIADFALMTNKQILEYGNAYIFGNKMRLIIESYARSNYDIENVTSAEMNNLINYFQVSEENRENFQRAIDLVNSLSHGRSYFDEQYQEISSKEIRDNIRFLLRVLAEKDMNHIKIVTNYKIKESQINQWFPNTFI